MLETNVGYARQFKPLTESEKSQLLEKSKEAALTGEFEPFKTTRNYDGPIGRKIHGIS